MSAAKQNWPRVKLGEVCEIVSTRGHQIKQSEICEAGRYPVVSQSANTIEGFTDVEIPITDTPIVLFGDHTCEVKLIERPFVVGADGVKLLRVSGAGSEYLYHWLKHASLQLLDGEYRRHYSDLCEMTIPLPPLPVQREIVARLERELGAVDELAKKFEELEQTAEAEFKAELAEEMGQLGQMGQLGRDAAVAEVSGVSTVPSTATRWVRLGEVCETCLGKMLDKAKNKGIPRPYIRNVNVRWFDFELTDLLQMPFESDEIERYSLRKGDIAMCEGGEPGRCAIWRGEDDTMMIQKAIHRIRPGRACLAEYLVYVFNNSAVNGSLSELFTGATIKHLTGQVLKQFNIPLPPLPVQRAIVARLDAAKTRKDKLVSAAKRGREAAAVCRKAILKEAFDG